MKRFFQPIQRDGSLKKPTLSSSCSLNGDQETGECTPDDEKKKRKKEPSKFLTWNANSFLLRVKNNWPEFTKLVETLDPDVIAIQEVRIPAAGAKGAPKNPKELKDDTNSSREEKQVLTLHRLLIKNTASNVSCKKHKSEAHLTAGLRFNVIR
ncbi:hypothetical protein RJ640_030300 [Escallonia rubra]|uniref:Endonuclease/exonuclease/phosphatase domain-containing protein n=1 Tax=Escallonia rubra TaxID=112253 RepID=A0AA88U2T3_9ASTE|nr:hypothetical protein RJ640_030300 [Escallonia rubra]